MLQIKIYKRASDGKLQTVGRTEENAALARALGMEIVGVALDNSAEHTLVATVGWRSQAGSDFLGSDFVFTAPNGTTFTWNNFREQWTNRPTAAGLGIR